MYTDTFWQLFIETGDIVCYLLYKKQTDSQAARRTHHKVFEGFQRKLFKKSFL